MQTKKLKFSYLIVLILLSSLGLKAQNNPIIVQSILNPPYPVYFTDAIENPGFANIIVQNTSMSESYKLRFRIVLEGGNGIKLLIPETVTPSHPLKISAGEVKTLYTQDILNIYAGISEKDIIYKGISLKQILQSQRIPDGAYKLCIQAYDNETLKPLSSQSPLGCSNKMVLTTLEPPMILSPQNNAEIVANNPQHILFQWSAVAGATTPILYDLRIAELQQGVSAYDAIQSDNFLFYEIKDYAATVFSYGPSLPQLNPDKQYVVQITAHGLNGDARIRNNGKSEVMVFKYLPQQSIKTFFPCNGNCDNPPPVSNTNDVPNLVPGETIKIGHFSIELTRVDKNNNTFSGQGLLTPTSFFLVPVWVGFDNISVNTEKVVYNGTINAIQKDELIEVDVFDENASHDPVGIYDFINDPAGTTVHYMSEAFDPTINAGVDLPIGYGQSGQSVYIVGMELSPTKSEMDLMVSYTMAGDFRNGQATFIFGVQNVCITPGGPAAGQSNSRLDLLQDVDYFPNEKYSIKFEAAQRGGIEGCFANINCDGIEDLHLGGVVSFSRDFLTPEDDNGNEIPDRSLAARFNVQTDNWDRWVADVNFTGTTDLEDAVISPNFRIPNMKNYSFTVENMYLDQSETLNPDGINFPTGFGNQDNSWKGIYIRSFDMLLPNYYQKQDSQRIEILGNDLIMDDDGLSFDATGENLMTEDNPGKFDEWDFTIKRLNFNMLRGDIQTAEMAGRIKFDIASTFIGYNIKIDFVNGNSEYTIGLQSSQALSVDMWGAKMNLDTNSRIDATVTDDDIDLTAVLSGNIELNNTIGDVNGINIKGIAFEGLELKTSSPYIENGTFVVLGNPHQTFGNFDIGIEDVKMEDYNGSAGSGSGLRKALGFDLNLEFGEEGSGFSAGTRLNLIAKRSNTAPYWSFDDYEVDKIILNGEVSSVAVDGMLEWYRLNDHWGTGFVGNLDATFIGINNFELETEMRLGNKDNVDYWYVDGSCVWGEVISLVGPLGLKGFGGGAYYNLQPKRNYNNQTVEFGENRSDAYFVKKNGWGFMASAFIGTTPVANMVAGEVSIEASFNDDVLSSLYLRGDFGMFQEPAVNQFSNAVPYINLNGEFLMNNTPGNRSLTADFGYDISIPRNPKIFWGSNSLAAIKFEVNNNDWKFWLGNPESNMINLTFGLNYKLFGKQFELGIGTNSYFDIGSELPNPPLLSDVVPESVVPELGDIRMESGEGASGVMAGYHSNFSLSKFTAFKVWGNGVSFEADAGFGIDMALRNFNSALCNGRSDFGINRWRAEARGYMYAQAYLRGEIAYHDFDIAGCGLYAAMHYAGPNPNFLKAKLTGKITLPVFGDYRLRTQFKMGEKCVYEVDEAFVENLALEGLLDEIYLNKDVDSVYPYDQAFAVMVDLDKVGGYTQEYEMANGEILKTKVIYKAELIAVEGDKEITISSATTEYPFRKSTSSRNELGGYEGILKIRGNEDRIIIYTKDWNNNPMLNANSDHRVRVTAKLMYAFDKQPDKVLKKPNGEKAIEIEEIDFITSKVPPLKIHSVVSASPYKNQRFFYLGENTEENSLYLQYSNDSLFDRYGDDIEIKVEFEDVVTGEVFESFGRVIKGDNKIVYNPPVKNPGNNVHLNGNNSIPALKRNRIYKASVYCKILSNTYYHKFKEIYDFHFRTSAYNTFQDKISDAKIILAETQHPNHNTMKKHILNIYAKEAFGENETFNLNFIGIYDGKSRDQYTVQRHANIAYALSNNIDFSKIAPEFRRDYSKYPKTGELNYTDISNAMAANQRNENPTGANNLDSKIVGQYVWNLNGYAFAIHTFVQLHRLDNKLQVHSYITSSNYKAKIKINDESLKTVPLIDLSSMPNNGLPENPINNNESGKDN